MRQNITMITLGVADIARSVAFYEALGWQKSAQSMDDLILFDLNGIILSLYPREALAEDIGIANDGKGFAGMTIAYNANSEAEVDEIMAIAKSKALKIVKPAQKAFWGGYSGYLQDPDGYCIEIAHNPFWNLDSTGNVKL